MLALFRLFFDIALLRKGPQNVPYSPFLFVFLFTFAFAMDIAMNFIPGYDGKVLDFGIFIRYIVVANVVIITVIFLLFKFYGKTDRFLQSLTAITGVELTLKFIQLPAVFLVMNGASNEPSMPIALAGLFFMVILGWYLIIYMHIFHIGLNLSKINAGMLSFVILILSFVIKALLVPVAT